MWSPRLKLCQLLELHLYTPAPVPFIGLDLSVHQTRLPLIFGLILFCQSLLSWNLTVTGLYTFLSVPTCRMGLGPTFQDCLA
jgi:hypothetical protein